MIKQDDDTLLFRALTEKEAKNGYLVSMTDAFIEHEPDYNLAYLARQCALLIRESCQSEEESDCELLYNSANPLIALYLRHAERYGLGIIKTNLNQITNTSYNLDTNDRPELSSIAYKRVEDVTKVNYSFLTKSNAEFVDKLARMNTINRPGEPLNDSTTGVGCVGIKMEPTNETVLIYRSDKEPLIEYISPEDVKQLKEELSVFYKDNKNLSYCEKNAILLESGIPTKFPNVNSKTIMQIFRSSLTVDLRELEIKAESSTYRLKFNIEK